ncbi:MmgE/PrpD family protein [Dickeya solani]|uniref:MmgE/PrpD family protein n=1 Tax=Dickeya solani TaxID=1089444 RepID=A0ABU4EPM7_9GAMM|nr:MmgE/PrpD family protein [Dickeya solani]MCA6999106.1 MmgE/PrpD family protein [Dickeya solani]MCZ0823067.1 MmgE/PrpD family protein [Dickeya solani]MDV6997078.1 MmgE/PrpD family protein [Dickeya solani]MDV7005033.1 MmgE/PrpD family protein [Dickeya solani]MDV7039149.1 MmgE/PrpD family protein [Dickeya solani]
MTTPSNQTDSLTLTLARFACQLAPEAIPALWRRTIVLHLLDTLGCGVAGLESDVFLQAQRMARQQYAVGASPVLGSQDGLSALGAAFVNSAAMNALDYDDGFERDGRGMGHPGATLVAAALAALDGRQVSGARLLCALAAGWEINGRVILAQQPSPERFRQVYGVCQHQSIGAAVVFGLLSGCDAVGLENAIGLAASLTPLPGLHKYNWQQRPLVAFKDYNAPATEAGVRGVLLHREGVIGPRDVLGGEHGFWRMAGSDRCDTSLLMDGLGDEWRLRHASFKRYPVCRWMHTALAAFELLLTQQRLSPDRIARIQVIGSRTLVRQFADTQVLSETDAQFSVPLALACLAYGLPRQGWSDAAARRNMTLLAFARRVELVVDDELDRLMAVQRRPVNRVRVDVDGQWLNAPAVDYPPGCEQNPMVEAEIVRKCRDNLSRRLGENESDRLIDALLELERQPDAGALLAPLFAG